jgi:aspartokinase-like uncharacterized kinase
MSTMWVVELGGGMSRDARLPRWLQMLAELGGGRVTVVPEGDIFADAARDAAAYWGIVGPAARAMAVLAMAQTAQMLHSMEPRLALAADETAIRRALHAGRPALWMPLAVLRDPSDVPADSEVTSDRLAVWLARRLNAERLVLVRSTSRSAWVPDAALVTEIVPADDIDRMRNALLGVP